MTLRPLNKILYVEDDPDIRFIAMMALEGGGFTIEECDSGAAALAKGPSFKPDLIMLDVMMPGMDGPTTLKALRADPQLANVDVIFMTAKVQPHEVAEYRALGALDVILKPFDPMTLCADIRRIWEIKNG